MKRSGRFQPTGRPRPSHRQLLFASRATRRTRMATVKKLALPKANAHRTATIRLDVAWKT
jgi:hypothetical protein